MGAYVVGLLVGFILDGAKVGRKDVGAIDGPDGLIVGQADGAVGRIDG